MTYETWLEHVSRHLERDGYQICKGADGMMQGGRTAVLGIAREFTIDDTTDFASLGIFFP